MVSMDSALEARRQGTALAFPAHLAHRVLPVETGLRRALIAWLHGPAFR
jgi:PKHD-type hydroxylase